MRSDLDDSDDSPVIATGGTIVMDPGHGGNNTVGSSSPNNAKGDRTPDLGIAD